MPDVVEVRIPRENVNDDRVLIMQWEIADGSSVSAGDVLVEVETSKSTFEVTSPVSGIVKIAVASDTEVRVGEILCYVGESLETIENYRNPSDRITPTLPPVRTTEPDDSVIKQRVAPHPLATRARSTARPQSTRFSRPALELLKARGQSPSDYPHRGLVRKRDLLLGDITAPSRAIVPDATLLAPLDSTITSASTVGVPFRKQSQPRMKQIESKLLYWSVRQAIRSAVTVAVPTRGRDTLSEAQSDATELLVAVLISECAQLLKSFPAFNACCLDSELRFYDQVNIAYALDAGKGLKAPVLRDADRLSPTEIVTQRQNLITAYLADELPPESFSGATFTVSDLSGSGVLQFDPLISEGQSAILGVGGEYAQSNGRSAYNLTLAFDHRLSEGRAATRFLNELKQRMMDWEHVILSRTQTNHQVAGPCCTRCGLPVADASRRQHFLVAVAGSSPSEPTQFVCTICLQGR